MKKLQYVKPSIEIEKFEVEDIITRSGPGRLPSEDDELLFGDDILE